MVVHVAGPRHPSDIDIEATVLELRENDLFAQFKTMAGMEMAVDVLSRFEQYRTLWKQ